MALIYRQGTVAISTTVSGHGQIQHGARSSISIPATLTGKLRKVTTPELSSATPQSSTVVRLAFSEPVPNDAALIDVENYVFTSPSGAAVLAPLSVSPEAVAEPTYVDVTVNEMTDGAAYEVEVENLEDVYGNAITGASASAVFSGEGSLPTLVSAVALGSKKIRLTFSENMLPSSLGSILGYSISPVTSGAALVYVESVSVPDTPTNLFVDLTVSEMTNGATYEARVSDQIGATDLAYNHADPGANTDQFTGVGSLPGVKLLIPQGLNRVDVIFTEVMFDNADIRNPANYVFDNGLEVLAVLEFYGDTVKLSTSDQTPGTLYTLTVG